MFAALVALTSMIQSEPPPLSLMSYNVRFSTADDGPDAWPNRKSMLFDLLREQKADIIGIQEGLHPQILEIVREVPEYSFVGVGREDSLFKGEHSAILYRRDRFNVMRSETFWLSDTPDVPNSMTWGNRVTRVCTWAQFSDRQGRPFTVFNVHLDHESEPARQKSAQMLADRLARHRPSMPLILMGDLNCGEDSWAVRYLTGKEVELSPGMPKSPMLIDTFRAFDPAAKEVGTFTGFEFGNTKGDKIDYIFVTPPVIVRQAGILRTSRDNRYPSDHFPVTATIAFP